ncbi:MAG: hypothetical protein Q4D04_13250 [Clostridia bacterium]|nr:hypothetical protein [Clostridia bacterium]
MIILIADGGLITAGKPGVEARALMFDRENNPVIACSQSGGTALIAYRYVEDTMTEINKISPSSFPAHNVGFRIDNPDMEPNIPGITI